MTLKCTSGYTLTELMVVVAIVAVLAWLAVPPFLDWNRKYQLRDAVGTFYGYLSLARMTAINQNTTVTVTVAQPTTADAVFVTFRNPTGTDVIAPLNMNRGLYGNVNNEVNLTNTNGDFVGAGISSTQDVQFMPNGLRLNTGTAGNLCIALPAGADYVPCTAATAQVFNFRNTKKDNYRVVILPTGKISWCYSSACAQ
jgi:prepilin-type N-terminal cleavage/methylation domain-containing protein